MLRYLLILITLAFSAALVLAPPAHAHGEDGDHAHGPEPVNAAKAPRIESVGTEIELIATADEHTLTIFLDRIATNEPVDGATIEVSGDGIPAAMAKRVSEGTYELDADWVGVPGTKALVFVVTTGGIADLLNGTIVIPGAPSLTQSGGWDFSDLIQHRGVWALLAAAFVLGALIATSLRPRSTPRTAEVILLAIMLGTLGPPPSFAGPGHDHGDGGHGEAPAQATANAPRKLPDGRLFVPKLTQRLLEVRTRPVVEERAAGTRELIGNVISDPTAFGRVQAPMDGLVEVGERGISFVGQKVAAGEVLGILSPTIPLADLGTVQQLRAEVDGKLKIAELKLARLTRISDVIAKRDIDDTRAELQALREQKLALAQQGVEKFLLKAPVSGVISVANVRAGQVVTARDTLFEIVDPNRLWIEAIGTDLHWDGSATAATAIDADGHSIKLSYIGQAPTLKQQSRPVLFKVEEVHDGLVIGGPVRVLAQDKKTVNGFIIPESAVVRSLSGLPQVWIKVSPEVFRPVAVRTEPVDGTRVVVTAGLETGARVVVSGAELINQIR